MTHPYFIELADYNIWANNEAVKWLENITPEQWTQPIVSSFGSIEATVFHMAGAEKLWGERLIKVPSPSFLPPDFKPSKEELLGIWKEASMQLRDAVLSFDPSQLNAKFGFRRLNGEYMELAYYHALAHIFNHSTYHRGQLLLLIKQAGVDKISSTDMLFYFNKS